MALADGDSYLMKVRAQREVPVTLRLEPLNVERVASHSGSGTWEQLCFDFTGVAGNVTGVTVIFDKGVVGDATNAPDDWTFQYDDIEKTSDPCPAAPAPTWETITFDDSGTNYTLSPFNGAASSVTNDPAGGMNMVATVVKDTMAQPSAGVTVSTLANNEVPVLPLSNERTRMSVRTWSPDVGITVRLKIEDASNGAIFVEADQLTTVADDWETLTFDFADAVSQAFDEANTYNRVSIFFDFGNTPAVDKTYYFDDVSVGYVPDSVVYATDPNVTEDLFVTPVNFGSGAVFDLAYAGDTSFNPALQVTSGNDFTDNPDVGFAAFTGYAAGFAAGFETLDFKVKGDPANLAVFEVQFFDAGGANPQVIDITTYSGSVDIGDGWYQVSVPLSDYSSSINTNDGFLIGPQGDQGAPFTWVLTDLGFSGSAATGGGTELVTNGGFESGVLDPWADFGNMLATITVTSAEAQEGSNSVNIIAGDSQTVFLRQSGLGAGSLANGDTVTVSFFMKGSITDVPVLPTLEGFGVLETIVSGSVSATDWVEYTYQRTLTADFPGGIFFEIGIPCGPVPTCSANVFIDNISVKGP